MVFHYTYLSSIHRHCRLWGALVMLLMGSLLSCQQPQNKVGHGASPTYADSIILPIKANNPQELARAWASSDSAKAAFLKRHRNITGMTWQEDFSSGGDFTDVASFHLNLTYTLEIAIGTDSLESYYLEYPKDIRLFRQRYKEDVPPPPPLGSPQAEAALLEVCLKGFKMRKTALGKSEAIEKKIEQETEAFEKVAKEAYWASRAKPTQ
jgi:hypothetical protein